MSNNLKYVQHQPVLLYCIENLILWCAVFWPILATYFFIAMIYVKYTWQLKVFISHFQSDIEFGSDRDTVLIISEYLSEYRKLEYQWRCNEYKNTVWQLVILLYTISVVAFLWLRLNTIAKAFIHDHWEQFGREFAYVSIFTFPLFALLVVGSPMTAAYNQLVNLVQKRISLLVEYNPNGYYYNNYGHVVKNTQTLYIQLSTELAMFLNELQYRPLKCTIFWQEVSYKEVARAVGILLVTRVVAYSFSNIA